MMKLTYGIILSLAVCAACSGPRGDSRDEEVTVKDSLATRIDTTQQNTVPGVQGARAFRTYPQKVILTGLPEHRLITVYKELRVEESVRSSFYKSRGNYDDDDNDYTHYMPGLDLINGYNLVGLGHYNLKTEKLNLFFEQPVLIKSVYFPSWVQDSLYKKPINRNYYLISVYDTDTNKDSVITKKDLRHFYVFNEGAATKTMILPDDHSVTRSQYDPANDVMYLFARHDANKNGFIENEEPLHVFWISLREPAVAKRLY